MSNKVDQTKILVCIIQKVTADKRKWCIQFTVSFASVGSFSLLLNLLGLSLRSTRGLGALNATCLMVSAWRIGLELRLVINVDENVQNKNYLTAGCKKNTSITNRLNCSNMTILFFSLANAVFCDIFSNSLLSLHNSSNIHKCTFTSFTINPKA